MTRNGALAGMVVGGLTVIVWAELENWFGLSAEQFSILGLYEIIPGFILAWIAAMAFSYIGEEPSDKMKEEFEESKANVV
ncbi:proline/sodium symporter PutP [Halalkalibacter wakoensis JCM 9140]|uniref:Proline/sodium symporter PutP n=1 Tax=Halalkalibacter wakoensis JCM 9140 TaxID=1236970 RepID=W4Q910_9BACI|nr:proline/sodium symporter PutP [Halalkalibacter wakoensis JCM 9140]